jgi:hypothetical protein
MRASDRTLPTALMRRHISEKNADTAGPNLSTSLSTAGMTFSTMTRENPSNAGMSIAPTRSWRFSNAIFIRAADVAVAAAVPPTWDSTSARMSFCADRTSPDLTRALIWSCCSLVKLTPARRRAPIPLTGSESALPSCIAAASVEPNTLPRSSMAFVALVNTSLPLPVSLRTCLKVRSMFIDDWIASSSTPVLNDNESARFWTCLAVSPAALPVDLMIASVWADTFCAS